MAERRDDSEAAELENASLERSFSCTPESSAREGGREAVGGGGHLRWIESSSERGWWVGGGWVGGWVGACVNHARSI